jgi:hypothetical protein
LYLGAAILHNPAENYQMFTPNDIFITCLIGVSLPGAIELTTKYRVIDAGRRRSEPQTVAPPGCPDRRVRPPRLCRRALLPHAGPLRAGCADRVPLSGRAAVMLDPSAAGSFRPAPAGEANPR